ncbi:DUF1345 domain-containing protein [Argonema galeatum]|uniref:DUF1345 domain-containing protein n=1 Tax=Argonema galeatum TaxID=2942762 RepID=UPI0020126FB9|nr:DUF1345 domain-containing protein [Argonema galeatum]MCL1465004.1 DUF1345 domain-containing protein [Argonema galeatum A003/A1]
MFKTLDAKPRLLISIGISALVSGLLPSSLHLPTRILCAWNSGVVCLLALAWWMMLSATPQKMRRNAQRQDESRLAILTLVIAAACTSVLAIVFVLNDKKGISTLLLTLHLTLSVMTIVGSWLLVHTMFALHYAHCYYRDDRDTASEGNAGGLDFPSDNEPDYWDFLYFSFVIGMTGQVSDVATTSRSMRRLALLHGVLSFFFNTAILAMSINIIAGLL